MKTATIARKDLEDVIRSKLIWGVFGLFVLLMGIIGLSAASDPEMAVLTEDFINLFANLGAWLMVPLIGIMIGYMAIVGERQSGSLRVLFGLGFSRNDVLAGKLVSRSIVIVVVTVASLLVMLAMMPLLGAEFNAGLFLRFAVLSVLLGVMFTTIAVAVSGATATRYRAMGGAIGAYVVFAMLWHPFAAGIHYLVEGNLPAYEAPEWYFLLTRLNPLEAYNQVISVWIDSYVWGLIGWVNVVEDIEVDIDGADALLLTERVGEDVPFYLTDWFAGVILLLWIIVPVTVAYWVFNRADLN